MTNVHDFTLQTIDGTPRSLKDFEGQVLLIVNVASECGLTPQYEALEALHRRLSSRGFSVLGFPCNDFGAQEPGSEAEIKQFCESRYGVSFPLFEKVHVLGPEKTPLYEHLTSIEAEPDGAGDIDWNFAKFVVGKDGRILARFSPTVKPDDPQVIEAIEAAL